MKTLIIIFLFLYAPIVHANGLPDADKDGIPDIDETEIYKTNPNASDTDGDGYNDREELINGYSPLNPDSKKLEDCDYDQDGLNDRLELNFKTDITDKDTDNDGYEDGKEIEHAYNPLSNTKEKLPKRIEIDTKTQNLNYFLGDVKMGTMVVSTGKTSTKTPLGKFEIISKHTKAWSSYGLWMPYWMSFKGQSYGIHELPIWPSGYQEGADHLGTPVSHGCVRLGTSEAKFMYDWTPIGTPVIIN